MTMKETTAINKFNDFRKQHEAAREALSAANQQLLGIQQLPTKGLTMQAVEDHFETMKAAMQHSRDVALELERITQELELAQAEAHAEKLANFHTRQPELEAEKNQAFIKFRDAINALLVAEQTYSTAHEAARENVVAYRHYCHEHSLPVEPLLQVNSLFHYEGAIYRQLEPVISRVTWRQQQINGNPHAKALGGMFTANPVPELEV